MFILVAFILDFNFIHLPLKSEKPEQEHVPSLGPQASAGVRKTKTSLCCGNLVSVDTPRPAVSSGTFVYRLRILHAPLALFLIRIG